MSDMRFICMDGQIREMAENEAIHEEAKGRVRDQIITLFKENNITLLEAEFIFRGVVENAIGKAKRRVTFSDVYPDT